MARVARRLPVAMFEYGEMAELLKGGGSIALIDVSFNLAASRQVDGAPFLLIPSTLVHRFFEELIGKRPWHVLAVVRLDAISSKRLC